MRVLPIIFKADMVRAILDGRKTVTRRAVKPQPDWFDCGICGDRNTPMKAVNMKDCEIKPPYQPRDILYVRETWGIVNLDYENKKAYICYKAGNEKENCRCVSLPEDKFEKLYNSMSENSPEWHPSIHMPKAAARIWLKVTDVRVERLWDAANPLKYPHGKDNTIIREGFKYTCDFIAGWNKTIKKSDLALYGWSANPWVWVIEFERCEKPDPCIIAGIEPAESKCPCIGYSRSIIYDEPCEMCKGCAKRDGFKEENNG